MTDIALNEPQWISEFLHHGLAEFHFAYDALGNVLGLSDPLNAAENRAFGYDALNSADKRRNLRSLNLGASTSSLRLKRPAPSYRLPQRGLAEVAVDSYGYTKSSVEVLGLNPTV